MERHTCQGYESTYNNYKFGLNSGKENKNLPYLFSNKENPFNPLKIPESYTSRNLGNSRSKSSNCYYFEDKAKFLASKKLPRHARKRSYNLRSKSRQSKVLKRRKASLQDLYFVANRNNKKTGGKPPVPAKKDSNRSFHINLKIELKENQEMENNPSNETANFGNRGHTRRFKIQNLSKKDGSPKKKNLRYLCSSSPKFSPESQNFPPRPKNRCSYIENSDEAIKVIENAVRFKRSKSGKMKIEQIHGQEVRSGNRTEKFDGIRELSCFESPEMKERRLTSFEAERMAGFILTDQLAKYVHFQVKSRASQFMIKKLFGEEGERKGVLSCRDGNLTMSRLI